MGRAARKEAEGKSARLTSVTEQRNTTTGRQVTLRLTAQEQHNLDGMIDHLREYLPAHRAEKVNRSRIFRAITYIQDKRVLKKIADSITENT